MNQILTNAFVDELHKIAETGGQSGETIVESGKDTPKRLTTNKTPLREVSPVKDPISGRLFSHAEREKKQSLRRSHRGPGWKETHPASEQPGKSKGPALVQPGESAFWGKGRYQ